MNHKFPKVRRVSATTRLFWWPKRKGRFLSTTKCIHYKF